MHDLETIERLNAEAHAKHINGLRARGQWVVAHYTGLQLLQHQAFDSAEAAVRHVDAQGRVPGDRYDILPPHSPAEAAAWLGRDQSEDLAVA